MAKKDGEAAAKTKDLPGMEDRAIQPLHNTAVEYDKVKKRRMKLTEKEVKLKAEVRTLMKAANRTRYAYDGVEVELAPPADAEDKVTVKVSTAADSDEATGEDE